MFDIFHFLQSDMVFGILNLFFWIFKAVSSEKSCLISMPFLLTDLHRRQDSEVFRTCWILIGQFKYEANQQYARSGYENTIIKYEKPPSLWL